jgi:tRNA modification GTPase
MYYGDTIVALATPRGNSALAVIRLSGRDSHGIFSDHIEEKNKFRDAAPFTLKRYLFRDTEEVVDEVTAIKFTAPASFTGEDMVEIICHGGHTVVERIISVLLSRDTRYADAGEFSRRAFLNGKLDLKKAESINRLIHAQSIASHKNAVAHYLGRERHFFNSLKENIQALLVDLETEIEFSDTDDIGDEMVLNRRIEELIEKIRNEFIAELHKRARLKEVDTGVDICLAGRTNAGKSSLFNALLHYDRALTNQKAGTTRDVITETRLLGGVPVRLVDTAGLNDVPGDDIERMGIEKTRAALEQSPVVLWVVSSDSGLHRQDLSLVSLKDTMVMGIVNKSDRADSDEAYRFLSGMDIPVYTVSAQSKEGVDALLQALEELIAERFSAAEYETVIGSDREEALIRKILAEIERVTPADTLDIQAEYLRNVLTYLENIYGKTSPEEVLNTIFGSFCIGK